MSMKYDVGGMEFVLDGLKRETSIDPLYKKIDSNGKIYVDKKAAGQEVLVLVVKPIPGDKDRYVKIGRG